MVTPMAGPCDSPKVVILKRLPYEFPTITFLKMIAAVNTNIVRMKMLAEILIHSNPPTLVKVLS